MITFSNRTNLWLVVVIISTFFGLGFLCWDSRESLLKSEIRELQLQLAESQQKADTFYVRDSIPVWKERIVEVDRTDYKKLLADKELIKQLKLRVAQIEAENRTLLGVRDTVYLREDSTVCLGENAQVVHGGDSGRVLRYRDEWVDFAYYEEKKRLEYAVRDSLSTFIAREYKHRFLWWKWGTKGYSVYIVNHNPRSKVYYNKYIRVKR